MFSEELTNEVIGTRTETQAEKEARKKKTSEGETTKVPCPQ